MGRKTFNPATDVPDLAGKVIFITGGNQGIGQETILALAPHNPSHIYLTARSVQKAEDTLTKLKTIAPNTPSTVIECELSSLASVKDAAKSLLSKTDRLDILILNAGVMNVPPATTTDGYEIQMGINHIGQALLAKLLLPTLEKNAERADTRIVVLSSSAGQLARGINYKTLKNDGKDLVLLGGTAMLYCQSKLANIYFAKTLAERYTEITTVAVHPGIVLTNLISSQSTFQKSLIKLSSYFTGGQLTPAEGAHNTLWAATAKKEDVESGAFYYPGSVETAGTSYIQDRKAATELWDWTQKELEGWKLD